MLSPKPQSHTHANACFQRGSHRTDSPEIYHHIHESCVSAALAGPAGAGSCALGYGWLGCCWLGRRWRSSEIRWRIWEKSGAATSELCAQVTGFVVATSERSEPRFYGAVFSICTRARLFMCVCGLSVCRFGLALGVVLRSGGGSVRNQGLPPLSSVPR
jgi:hypothetical protein